MHRAPQNLRRAFRGPQGLAGLGSGEHAEPPRTSPAYNE